VASAGNNLNDFPDNQPTTFRAVYAVNINQGPNVCRQSFTRDSLTEKIEITNPCGVRWPLP